MKIYATESGNDVKYPLEHCFSRLVWYSNVCLGKIKIALEFFCRIWCLYCVAKTPFGVCYNIHKSGFIGVIYRPVTHVNKLLYYCVL